MKFSKMLPVAILRFGCLFLFIFFISSSQATAQNKKETKNTEEESDPEIDKLKKTREKLSLLNDIADERWKQTSNEKKRELEKVDLARASELQELSYEESKIRAEKTRLDLELSRMKIQIARKEKELADQKLVSDALSLKILQREQREKWESNVNTAVNYRNNPVENKTLYLSDRVVHLNGIISYESATLVIERLQFLANLSQTKPIFLVIDSSPGGSVMAGYQIIRAMRSSKAPVYVLVKSYAASMAATIAALSEKSYCFSSTIILHHQIHGKNEGNPTQQKEKLALAQEWNRRIAGPVAQKMNLSLDQFVKKMYENNSEGDWMEFGDKAVQLKWITAVIDEVVDESVRQKPQEPPVNTMSIQIVGKKPELHPFDLLYMYQADQYFKTVNQ